MAITRGDVDVWLALKNFNLLPAFPRMLELGDAQWYGDVSLEEVGLQDVPLVGDVVTDTFRLAKEFYARHLGVVDRVAIDGTGALDPTIVYDLNTPLDPAIFGRMPFDIVVNTGTFEHVFNQHQLWKTAHDWCRPGGIMFHSLPVSGWEEHGFYTFQPNLIGAIATANNYKVEGWLVSELKGGAMLHVAFRKDDPPATFVTPQQTQARYDY